MTRTHQEESHDCPEPRRKHRRTRAGHVVGGGGRERKTERERVSREERGKKAGRARGRDEEEAG